MTYVEALEFAAKMRSLGTVILKVRVARILPYELDPIVDGDNGWDVRVEVQDNE